MIACRIPDISHVRSHFPRPVTCSPSSKKRVHGVELDVKCGEEMDWSSDLTINLDCRGMGGKSDLPVIFSRFVRRL